MYIPILKNQREELKALSRLNACFNEDMIPMIEIINELYVPRYAKDGEGNILKELKVGNKRKTPVVLPSTEEDIITLEEINRALHNKTAFIDYFRFSSRTYKKFNIDKVYLSYLLSRNYDLYISKIHNLSSYPNLIPVISLKDGYNIEARVLTLLVDEMQSKFQSIAIRITNSLFDYHSVLLSNQLRETDFLLFDINEQPIRSLSYEISDLKALSTQCKKIVINSPRKRDLQNPSYEEDDYTDLIDNSVAKLASNTALYGFGDYCGLRDKLPSGTGSSGKGCALALIYSYEENKFFSIKNPDSSLGLRGYSTVKNKVINKGTEFNPLNTCLGYKYIESISTNGSWSTWHGFTLTRYIHQMYLNL